MSLAPLRFQIRDLLWLYIPTVKDIKEKEEDSGERPFLIMETKGGVYELATMTGHYKKPDYQYRIQFETNQEFQGRPINYNTKVYLTEEILSKIMGKIFNYYRPYQLNELDFSEFKKHQVNYFSNPKLLGKRYEI
jgi:hypothetical protein